MTKKYTNWLRNITAACLAMVIFTTSSMIALARTENKSLMGEITVSGQNANGNAPFVLLNGEQVLTGRTFFSNGTIATSEAVTSTISLGKAGYIILSPNSTLTVSFDEKSISGTLSAGQAQVFNAEGINVNIRNIGNATNSVVPVNNQKKDDDDDGMLGGGALVPVLFLVGAVAGVVVLVILNDDDDNNLVVSPVR